MNQQQNNLNRILIVVGVLALVAIGAYFMVIQQKLNQVAVSRAQLSDLQNQFAELDSVARQKPMYLALIRQVQSRLTGVELTADPRAYIPSYLKQIEDLAKRDGLVVTAVVPQPAPTPSGGPTAGPTPGVGALEKAPGIGAPLSSAHRAFNATTAQVDAENSQMPQAQTPAVAGATPVPGASGSAAGPKVKAGATTSPAVNAKVYLSQSFETVPINMELSGTYTDLQKFLRDLNKFPKLIGVGSVTLTSTHGAVGETPKLHIVLPIAAYRLSPNGPAPQATPPPDASNGG
jgi:Tfp pilus assembly protein PilO